MASFSSFTRKSKNSFQVIIWVVKRKGLTRLNKGMFIVLSSVLTMITLMVATIGPIEFSANKDKRKPRAATVVIASAAKQNAMNQSAYSMAPIQTPNFTEEQLVEMFEKDKQSESTKKSQKKKDKSKKTKK